jgi:putative FmdB family regulatory protein
MPIYEYVCASCDTKFEMLRPMSRANEKAACPECKHESERVLSTFACCSTDSTGMTSSIAGSGSS